MARPEGISPALVNLVAQRLGVRLFTILLVDRAAGEAARILSNMPEAYPVSGRKPMGEDAFTRALLQDGQTMVLNSAEEIAAQFPDHGLIRDLECESCLNVPVMVEGTVLGAMNFLHDAGHWTPPRIAEAEALRPAGAIYLLWSMARDQAAPAAIS